MRLTYFLKAYHDDSGVRCRCSRILYPDICIWLAFASVFLVSMYSMLNERIREKTLDKRSNLRKVFY
jgi:hypothetical protein